MSRDTFYDKAYAKVIQPDIEFLGDNTLLVSESIIFRISSILNKVVTAQDVANILTNWIKEEYGNLSEEGNIYENPELKPCQ